MSQNHLLMCVAGYAQNFAVCDAHNGSGPSNLHARLQLAIKSCQKHPPSAASKATCVGSYLHLLLLLPPRSAGVDCARTLEVAVKVRPFGSSTTVHSNGVQQCLEFPAEITLAIGPKSKCCQLVSAKTWFRSDLRCSVVPCFQLGFTAACLGPHDAYAFMHVCLVQHFAAMCP